MKGKRRISKAAVLISYVLSIVIVAGLVVGNVYALKYQNLISVYFNHPTQKVISSEV